MSKDFQNIRAFKKVLHVKIQLQNLKNSEKLEKEDLLLSGWFVIYGIIEVNYISREAFMARKIHLT